MIGLVLVTHGELAVEFLHAVEHVVGAQEKFATICIYPDDDIDQRRGDIIAAVSSTDTNHGVIILTDVFGGTPSNIAIPAIEKGRVEMIAGVNLPMLIKLISIRQCPDISLSEALRIAQEAGRKYINVPV
ncbi:PTS system mannose-specific IIA component [Bartonella callosciuri]|uniref:PTS system mannose-specific IIA component n=1 Tax=Bartonella callosciuri TaxID=686223 RepID=A0A840NQK2_9HYPH|nr:PTS sugar transporter subunit IIA [Bartonella callosciuri]MBB5073794.1 PTS system mannose-specific IIA component [Bartonella callosciuri]